MLHKNITTGDVHYIQNWSVADTTARDALSVVAGDVGKVCQVTGTSSYYILTDDSPMTWQLIGSGAGGGDVVGPASATDNAIVRFDGTTGKLIQNSAATVADTSGDITAGKYNTVAISGASTPDLTVTGTTTVSGANTGDQNLFSTIAVSGQSNVVADSTSDTLTLVAGTNVTITTDAGTDSITINASGGGSLPSDSTVRLHTANGFGSTNTVIRRFTTTVTNTGTDITYADSATNGATFTINTTGRYAIGFTDSSGSATDFGISLNSSQLTTGISGITDADRLSMVTTGGANYRGFCGSTLTLTAGDVIRAHTSGTSGGIANNTQFTITRIG